MDIGYAVHLQRPICSQQLLLLWLDTQLNEQRHNSGAFNELTSSSTLCMA